MITSSKYNREVLLFCFVCNRACVIPIILCLKLLGRVAVRSSHQCAEDGCTPSAQGSWVTHCACKTVRRHHRQQHKHPQTHSPDSKTAWGPVDCDGRCRHCHTECHIFYSFKYSGLFIACFQTLLVQNQMS